MHITVSFKDHSSFCTCMLLIKETKKKILNDWTETRKSPQTNKQPANERGDLSVNRAVRNCCVQQRVFCHCLRSTLNMATPGKAVTGERDSVDEGGLHFPTKPAQVLKLFRLHYLKFGTGLCYCSLRDIFVLVPANPGHFKVPYLHWTRCKLHRLFKIENIFNSGCKTCMCDVVSDLTKHEDNP